MDFGLSKPKFITRKLSKFILCMFLSALFTSIRAI